MSLPLPQVPWFTNLSIGKKLALAVAPLLLSLIFSTLAYEYANNRQLSGREMSNRFHLAVKHAKTVYECMLQARRGEKDFFLRLDEKYVEEVTNQITCIQSSAFDLQEMATQLDE
ncbi:MAG: hypothetical protein G8345_09160, partial [Magnetococcales bacterium]|nr:hypothetical protein [Magnetococcales bacterium]